MSIEFIKLDHILIEAEEQLLAFCLFNPDILVQTSICTDDLSITPHRLIFGAMRKLWEQGTVPSFIPVIDYLTSKNQLDQVGGRETFARIMGIPADLSITPWQELEALIKKRALQRKLVEVSRRIEAIAQDNLNTPTEALDKCQQLMLAIQNNTSEYKTLDPAAFSLELYDYLTNPPRQPLQFGSEYWDLDKHLGGITDGVTIVAGDTSMGKSHVLLWFSSLLMKRHKVPVLYVTPEMSRHQIGIRMLAHLSGIDSRAIAALRRDPNGPHWEKIAQATGELAELPWYVNDHESPSFTLIEADIRKIVSKHKYIGGVVVDYLQQLPPVNGYQADSPQELGRRVQLLHNLARKYSCPIWVGCQINRSTVGAADKRPSKNMLRGSGEIAEKAENVLLLYRPGYHSKDPYDDTLEIIVEKARNGLTGTIKLTCDFRTSYLFGTKEL